MRQDSNLSTRPAPRAIVGGLRGIRAEGNAATIIAQLTKAFGDFKADHNAAIAELNERIAVGNLGAAAAGAFRPDDPDYSAAFASYFRNGGDALEAQIREMNATGRRAQIQAAMSVGTADSGGYLAPTEWDRRISQAQVATSPMRRLATVQSTTVGAYTTLWNDNVWGSGWVGETAARPETTTPGLDPVTFAAGEIYANPAITQRLLDDADFDIEQWLADQVEAEFNKQEGIAFLSGNGTNKPRGLLTYVSGGASTGVHPGGDLTVVVSGHATLLGADTSAALDTLIGFAYGLPAPYRQNATWLMNSNTAATLAKFKDADGNLIYRESLIVGQPATLLGRPVEFDEGMPSIGAGNVPIAFGDFKAGYLINDRTGSRILRDPYTTKPYVSFYVTKRVGAGVADPNAIRLLKIAAA